MDDFANDRFETVIIGGGQAGLATGYHLTQRDLPFVILDANERIGDAWRTRWDSLHLFTPALADGLPGWPFPAPAWSFPSKDEMADYLEAYATKFELPVRNGVGVAGVSRAGERYVVTTGDGTIEADQVVVATGANRIPKVPSFASELGSGITQLHSSEYLRPSQLRDGAVLVVGVGNSGAEIALELSGTRPTFLAGKEAGQAPVRHGDYLPGRTFFRFARFVGTHVLTKGTAIGRKIGPKIAGEATPLIRVRTKDLDAAEIERVPRVAGVRDGLPSLDDGRVLEVANVVWCTGYRQDYSWIDLPIFDDMGAPMDERGVVTSEPGVCFMGQIFQYGVTSDVLPGIDRDAAYVADHIATRRNTLVGVG